MGGKEEKNSKALRGYLIALWLTGRSLNLLLGSPVRTSQVKLLSDPSKLEFTAVTMELCVYLPLEAM